MQRQAHLVGQLGQHALVGVTQSNDARVLEFTDLLQMVAACNDDFHLAGSDESGEVREAVAISYSLEPSVPEEGRRRLMLGAIQVGLLYLLPSE